MRARILALDLGTKMGWAFTYGDGFAQSGTEILASPEEIAAQRQEGKDRLCDLRVMRLRFWLTRTLQSFGSNPPTVGFEDVQFASTSMQAHLWASFRTVVWLTAHDAGARIVACPVGTLKKFATGSGAATKGDMLMALNRFYPGKAVIKTTKKGNLTATTADGRKLDDNEVDALHLLRYIEAKKLS